MANPILAALADSLSRGVSRCGRLHQESRFWAHLKGKLRRLYLIRFRPEYVAEQLGRRQGECRRCANCCRLCYPCPFLNRQSLCVIYTKGRPQVCRVFPIDERDIREVALRGAKCGYRFESADPKPVARPEALTRSSGS